MDNDSCIIVIRRMIVLGKDPSIWVHLTVRESNLNKVLNEVIKNENSRTKDI
jgi:hypothetical protein